MSSSRQIEVRTGDHPTQKWGVSLKEDVFKRFISQESPLLHQIFGDQGSLFSPLLFGKYFDPCDAFPLWEFDSAILLSSLRSSGKTAVDWSQSDQEYVLKAEIPGGALENNVQVCVDNWKIVEISGQWRPQNKESSKVKDWRCGNWWEHGFVRRLELPEDADWRGMEVKLNGEVYIELRIPKKGSSSEGKFGRATEPENV
ncbi:hypothetical protein SAY87_021272 [Trapa incisa]|uniref:SHSP domain-containing protein n=1 Tax=Trapa incisa TaxID=236973 RepID=A0AAN7JS11_9MYRT|nr:hypothetical protein SAY87_021272 [Trapa incisa]